MKCKLLLAGVLCAVISIAATAQTPDNKIPVYKLDLRKVPDIPEGDAALVKGEAGSTPDRFFLENLYMLKPVSVSVRAVNPGGVVNVKITKSKWTDVLREGTTGADAQVNFKFRTQGEFQISITSPNPNTPYKMVVWVGKDIVPKAKQVFVPKSQFKGGGPSRLWWWIGGGAVVIVGILLALVLRKRKQS
ncbi:MAG TPA: hypothetical protein VGO61_21195 [Steroidobacteraceae bacterium]|nr:hypothetical protein [Steroidobacteraceae bacterium]